MPDPRTISIQIPPPSHPSRQSRAASFPAARDLHPFHSPHHPVRRTPWIIQLRIHRLQPTPSPHPRTGTQHHANCQNNHRLQQCHGVYIFDFVVSIRPGHGMTSPPQVPPSLRYPHLHGTSKMSPCLQRNTFSQASALFAPSFQHRRSSLLDSHLHGTPHASLTP